MPTTTTVLTFALATLALLAVPGPSVAFVVARTLEEGRTAGLVSVLGLETGAALHVIGAAAGLSALLAASPTAMTALKYAGAGYLVTLGVRQFRARLVDAGQSPAARTRAALFGQGVLVDLLNPKTGLFFLAFLPQFVEPGRGPVGGQVLVLGLIFVLLATLTDSTYALLAHAAGRRLGRAAGRNPWLRRSTGGVYVGLGGVTALV